MIDVSKTDKELSSHVLYAIKWFEENGFAGELIVNNTKKTEFLISKDGIQETFTLTVAKQNPHKCDIAKYMELFAKSFELRQKIEQFKK